MCPVIHTLKMLPGLPLRVAAATAALAVILLASGCATERAAPISSLLPPGSRLAVLQLPASVGDGSLLRVLHRDEKDMPAGTLAADRRQIEAEVDADLARTLPGAEDRALASAALISFDGGESMAIGKPLDAPTLARLRAEHPADAYLRLRVTDYGQTPQAWKGAYVSFEVVTTLGIGVLLYVHETTRPLAFLYVGQEAVEEYGEGYAGNWLLDRMSRPVRIDTDLIDGTDGAVLWRDSVTGLAAWRWDHLWNMDDPTRDRLLNSSTGRVIADLVTELGKK